MPTVTDKKSPNKSLLSSAKGPGKVQPKETENFLINNCSTLAKHQRKKPYVHSHTCQQINTKQTKIKEIQE